MHITFLRHGRSRADDEGVHEGRYDAPLTATGREQAHRLAQYWHARQPGFSRIVCSPLLRAHETAAILANVLGLELLTDSDWMEFDNGPLAGLKHDEALRKYPVPSSRGRFEPFTRDGGESEAAFHRRAGVAVERLVQYEGEHLLVVAHGGILNAALRELTGGSRLWFEFGDTGFTTVKFNASRDTLLVLGVNQQPHLAADSVQ
ncbi:histidine phosphatase family protein [Deinococcus hopiensis]|uniref:2,3-bisphosphoglycerate-dependent phosphoglycerate mutase n=1 Tax=Deinococcus hopiensis KR-140 TaxID=695939 RepID=A0A1W1U9V3_9DEIO|nr:histidine phosphatase family protein [Deinococcus hopiensis]SMB77823.1 2,3-bisphosphoglycerate-dependent phosphoglycerate mutase [Deinococcus hopiensis KR-140]